MFRSLLSKTTLVVEVDGKNMYRLSVWDAIDKKVN